MDDPPSDYDRLIAPLEVRMMRSIWRIVADPDEAEDVFQEALVTIWKRWRQLRKHPNPQALVLRICVNSAYDSLRRRTRRTKWLDGGALPEDVPAALPSAFQNLAAGEERARVLRAIGTLSRNQAKAILMHAVEEIPYDEIAAAMHCREATVRTHVARARARLRSLLASLVSPLREQEGSHA
jgi:RNA polymerase sigma-70 factor (ECF subfamily)